MAVVVAKSIGAFFSPKLGGFFLVQLEDFSLSWRHISKF
jgi:hypothetical protein